MVAVPVLERFNLIEAGANWLDDRFGWRAVWAVAGKKEVPVHKHSLWYYMGGIAMLFVGLQIVTGLLLMLYYVPEIDAAYSSVQTLIHEVPFGWLIRSLHSWGANLFILVLFFHMFSAFFMKAYRAPREITWLTGLGLLAVAMIFGFSGYLLPMDEIAYFATKVGVDVAGESPVIGEYIARIALGGEDISQDTLSRFFTLHVIALPAALAGLLGIHLLLVQLHGISEPESVQAIPKSERKYEKFFPDFALKDALVWLLVLNVAILICCLFPWHLGPQADPAAPAPLGIRPEWYFLSQFQVLKVMPAINLGLFEISSFLVAASTIGATIGSLFLVPFIDTGRFKTIGKLTTIYGVLFVLGFIALTIWGMVS